MRTHQAKPRLLARLKSALCRLGLADLLGLSEYCERCGKCVRDYWWASPGLWHEVMAEYGQVRCLRCFSQECYSRGIIVRWVPLVAHRRDARGQWSEAAPPDPEFHPVAARLHAEASRQ